MFKIYLCLILHGRTSGASVVFRCCQSFSSGCLLTLVLIHMMPEIFEEFSTLPHEVWIKWNLGLETEAKLNAFAGSVVMGGKFGRNL